MMFSFKSLAPTGFGEALKIEQFGSVAIVPAFVKKLKVMLEVLPIRAGPVLAINGNVTLLPLFVKVTGPDTEPSAIDAIATQRTVMGGRPSGRDSVPIHVPEKLVIATPLELVELPLGLVGLPDPAPDPPQPTAKMSTEPATASVHKALAEGHE